MFGPFPLPLLPREAALALLIVGGGVLLLYGWRLYRIVLIMVVVLACGLLAAWFVRKWGVWAMLAAGLPAGLISGLVALSFERYGVFVLGCVSGAAPILDSEVYFFSDHNMYFAALGAGLIAGSLAVLFWKPGIILCLSGLGAVCLERGGLLAAEYFKPGLGERLVAQHNLPLCLALLGLTLAGVLVQFRETNPPDGPILNPKPETAS